MLPDPKPRSAPRRLAVARVLCAQAILLLACIESGCAASARELRQVEYELGGPTLVESALEGGLFHVQFRAGTNDRWESLQGSERILSEGDRLGFETTGQHQVIAVARGERFSLDQLPSDARYCAWVVTLAAPHRSSRPLDEEKLRRAGSTALDVAARAGASAVTGRPLLEPILKSPR